MNTRSKTVHTMAETNFLDRIFQSALGRIFVAALQTVLTSQLLLLTLLVGRHVDLLLLKYTIVLAVGLMAGFSSRRFLAGHTRAVILLSGFLSAALSLAALYILSGGFLGINLVNRTAYAPDWHSLIQLFVAAFGTWLTGTAFRKKKPVLESAGLETLPAPAPRPKTAGEARNWLPRIKLPARKKPKPARISGENKAAVKAALPKRTKSPPVKPLPVTPAPSLPVKKQAARKKRKSAKPEITFLGTETYTCPYCLDEVQEHDPRGVKICQICKTRHHADCWGITGACQIPHSNQKK